MCVEYLNFILKTVVSKAKKKKLSAYMQIAVSKDDVSQVSQNLI